jgi:histidine triad (HIT) family protein
MDECVFCKIVSGAFGTELLGETDLSIAFRDINPEQSVHALIVPKAHYRDIVEMAAASNDELLDVITLGIKIAEQQTGGAFQFKFNTGSDAGQTVFHAHGHILSNNPKEQVLD